MANLAAPFRRGTVRCDSFKYNFAVDGGLIGVYNSPFELPTGALIMCTGINSIQSFNSANPLATIDVLALGSSVIGGAVTFGSAGIPTAGQFFPNVAPNTSTSVTGIVIPQPATLQFQIAVADLTAGEAEIWVMYVLPHNI